MPKTRAAFQQVRREGVAQRVGRGRLHHAGGGEGAGEELLDGAGGDMPGRAGARKDPRVGAWGWTALDESRSRARVERRV